MKKRIIIILIVFLIGGGVAFADGIMDFSSPEATYRTYIQACKDLDFSRSDLCYTREFRRFIKTNKRYLSHRHPGQLRNEYNQHKNRSYELEMHGDKAIMRFAPEYVRPAPFYFRKENGEWKIDAMFSFNNVIMEGSSRWFWRNEKIDNEGKWLRQ